MELFITEIPEPETFTVRPTVEDYDLHGENLVLGICEVCWGQDKLDYLRVWHPTVGQHTLAHDGCVERAGGCDRWEYCTCL